MDIFLSKLIDIELALSDFNSNVYRAGLALFKALNYPIKPLGGVINEDIKHFIYFSLESRIQFSLEELGFLNSVRSISILFAVEPGDIGCEDSQSSKGFFSKILFFAIELECRIEARSINAFSITKIFSKIYHHPVYILFYYRDAIMFSGLLYKDIHNQLSGKVYLSDWYKCVDDYEASGKLFRLMFEYQSIQNIKEMFCDMVFAISRDYYTYLESYEYRSYGCFAGKAGYISFVEDEDGPMSYAKKMDQEHVLWYIEQYGDDFIVGEETVGLLLPESDEWLLDELDGLFPDEADVEDSCIDFNEEDSEEEDSFKDERPLSDNYTLPEGFDEALFADPVKLLEWLEKS